MILPLRQRGFTLLEVLVAFIIAALAIAALLQGAGGGLRNARVATHTEEAVARAQSRLALLSVSLQPGDQSGDDGGGYLWRTSVQPGPAIARPNANANANGNTIGGANRPPRPVQTVLYAVAVTVSWSMDGGTRAVTLSSQRLGTTAPEPP